MIYTIGYNDCPSPDCSTLGSSGVSLTLIVLGAARRMFSAGNMKYGRF
jgi:hypothetical protein